MLSKFSRLEMLFTFLILVSMVFSVQAATCGTDEFTASSTSTSACTGGPGTKNPQEADVKDVFPSAQQVDMVTEIEDGDATAKSGLPVLFSVNLSSNSSWGQYPSNGTWAIDQQFWNIFESAAITIHGGKGAAIFTVVPGSIQGEWSITGTGKGYGLSNIKLWGVNKVPEPSVLALFSIGFAGLVYIRRKRAK